MTAGARLLEDGPAVGRLCAGGSREYGERGDGSNDNGDWFHGFPKP
jgi:hypothetical protein